MMLIKNPYKKVIFFLVVLIVGIVAFLLYSNLSQNHSKNQHQTDIIDEENDIRMEGYLYPTENGYGLMGWNVTGDIDFKSYMEKRIVVVGKKGENPDEVIVADIIEIEDDSKIETRETVVYGVLKKGNDESPMDRHYKIGNFDIRTDKDLSEYIDKEVAALVDAVASDKMTIKHGDLIEINIPYTIKGTLEVLSKENGHYHYKLGEYDVHSIMDITRYEGDYLKLLVFDGQHGSKKKQSNIGKGSINKNEGVSLLFYDIN